MKSQSLRTLLLAGLVLAGMAGTGCSTSYSHAWKKAAAPPPSPGSLEGRWQGTWVSDKNGHTGKLRCIVTPVDAREYEFHYWASFWKLFSATYKVRLKAETAEEGAIRLQGEKDLGKMAGGVFTYQGTARPGSITAVYHSSSDSGRFEMTRPKE